MTLVSTVADALPPAGSRAGYSIRDATALGGCDRRNVHGAQARAWIAARPKSAGRADRRCRPAITPPGLSFDANQLGSHHGRGTQDTSSADRSSTTAIVYRLTAPRSALQYARPGGRVAARAVRTPALSARKIPAAPAWTVAQ